MAHHPLRPLPQLAGACLLVPARACSCLLVPARACSCLLVPARACSCLFLPTCPRACVPAPPLARAAQNVNQQGARPLLLAQASEAAEPTQFLLVRCPRRRARAVANYAG